MSRNPPSASLALGPNPLRWPVFRPLNPSAAGTLIALNKPICVVGARALVHMHLNSPQVSRAHALILLERGRVYVRDLASKNGTYRNGDLIREAELYASDMIRFGPFILNCQANFPLTPLAEGDDAEMGDGTVAGELELDASGRRIDLSPRTVLIGRRSGCDVVLTEREISRAHAVVFRHEGRQFVRDLNSKNGTFVNGQKVRQAELQDQDQIQIGPHTLRYSAQPQLVEETGEADVALSGSHLSLVDPLTGSGSGSGGAGSKGAEISSQVGSTTHSGTLLNLAGPGAASVAGGPDALSASQHDTKEWTGADSGGLAAGASPSWMGGSGDLPPVEATAEELLATRDRLPVVGNGDGAAVPDDHLPWLPADEEAAKPVDLFGEGSSAGLAQAPAAGAENDGGLPAVSMEYNLAPWPEAAGDGVTPAPAESLEADAAELFAETPAFDELAPGKPADQDLLLLSEHDLSPDHSGRGDKNAAAARRVPGDSGNGSAPAADAPARRGTWRDLTAPSGQ